MTPREILIKKARDFREGRTEFILVKQGRSWAIYDCTARVYYYGKKKDLQKRLAELNSPKELTYSDELYLESRGER